MVKLGPEIVEEQQGQSKTQSIRVRVLRCPDPLRVPTRLQPTVDPGHRIEQGIPCAETLAAAKQRQPLSVALLGVPCGIAILITVAGQYLDQFSDEGHAAHLSGCHCIPV